MKKYTLLFLFLLFTVFVQAQAVKVIIDSTYNYQTNGGNSQETPIDIDNDGDTDFTFQYLKDNFVVIAHVGSYSSNGEVLRSGFDIRNLAENQEVSASSSGSFDTPSSFTPSGMFQSFRLMFSFCSMFVCNSNGSFTEATNRYVGVRFRQDESSEWQYGYIGITASVASNIEDAFITINSFGYEKTPGTAILTGAGVVSSTLPVELLDFQAVNTKDGVRLNWETSTETDNDYFTIERSEDGVNFIDILEVSAAGNTTTTQIYEVIDPELPVATVYYRLRQTDFDGTSSFSDIVTLDRLPAVEAKVQVFPNPSTEFITVQLNSLATSKTKISLFGLEGKLLRTVVIEPGSSMGKVDVQSLHGGNYLLMVERAESNSVELVTIAH